MQTSSDLFCLFGKGQAAVSVRLLGQMLGRLKLLFSVGKTAELELA